MSLGSITFSDVANTVVLISAVIIAAKNILSFLKKPVDDIGNKMNEAEELHIKEVIQQEVPDLLIKHSEVVSEQRKKETKQMIEELKSSLTSIIDDKFEDLKEIVLDQGVEIKEIKDTLEKVKESSKDVLRIRMNEIYYKYLPYRQICDSDKKLFDSLYKDYAQLKGNSAWQSMNDVVQTWTVVSDDSV